MTDDATARRRRGVVLTASPDGRRGARLCPAATALARLGGMPERVLLRVHSVGSHHCGSTRVTHRTYHTTSTVSIVQ